MTGNVFDFGFTFDLADGDAIHRPDLSFGQTGGATR
jgi:hypothetical protein